MPSVGWMSHAACSFSILGRIEPTATPIGGGIWHETSHLSVSSVGSSPLQLDWAAGGPGAFGSFSILGRIEPTATPRHKPWKREDIDAFSILGRIEPTATSQVRPDPSGPRASFQYPRSDRAHCNLSGGRGTLRLTIFQYPRSDRAHCNRTTHRGPHGRELPFSILGRIEPTATAMAGGLVDPSPGPFSILGRIEPTATSSSPRAS